VPAPSSRHISFKGKRRFSKLEHHERVPSFDKSDEKEKPQTENGDIVLTNVVSRKIFVDNFDHTREIFSAWMKITTFFRKII